ncbi:MAG: hypothetical protein MRY21_05050 [Simkaniaceae bacterium]|nr:hypothetical protein [Simkaniaceae bacterium]
MSKYVIACLSALVLTTQAFADEPEETTTEQTEQTAEVTTEATAEATTEVEAAAE